VDDVVYIVDVVEVVVDDVDVEYDDQDVLDEDVDDDEDPVSELETTDTADAPPGGTYTTPVDDARTPVGESPDASPGTPVESSLSASVEASTTPVPD